MRIEAIPEADEKVRALNKRAEARAQEMVTYLPGGIDEAYVLMMSHLIAFVGVAKATDFPTEAQQRLLQTANEVVSVFRMSEAGNA